MTPMGRYRTVYNPTDSPVVIDDEGRIAAGREWTPVLASHELVRAAVDRAALVFVDPPKDEEGLNPAALDAFHRTAALNEADGPEELAQVADDTGATPTPAAKRAAAKAAAQAEEEK
jgi:hypothetical protein